ncbi:MAG: class I SAM-dependent methyltransferase [Methanobacteriaceae archaeon]|nr:class I SAM-dependent methyltransferase [Methanobacteriaceae archaeon]
MLTEYRMKMLNREASSPKNKPSAIVEHLDIVDGMVVGDIGCGGGYFTYKFSKKVGLNGRVYAIDTHRKSLDYIGNKSRKEMLNNIKPVLAEENGFKLPETVDLFFLRNVFHHLHNRVEYFKNIKQFLKNKGRIAIIDYEKKKYTFTGLFGHYTPESVLLDIMNKAGFYPLEKHEFLPDQLFVIFARKGD